MGDRNAQGDFDSSDVLLPDKMSYCNGIFVKIGVFMSRIEPLMLIAGIFLGFFWFLLPSVHEGTRQMLHEIPFAYAVFDSFTRLKVPAVLFICAMVAYSVFLVKISHSRGFPGGFDVHKEGRLPDAKVVVEKKLFPASKSESFIFSVWVVAGFFSIFVSASPLIFLGYFIRIGK